MPTVYQVILARRSRLAKNPSQATETLARLSIGFIAAGSCLFALAAIAMVGLFAILLQDLPSLEALPVLFEPPRGLILEPTRIYDRTGQHLIATLENPAATDREYLTLEGGERGHFPSWLIAATITAHDPRFWENPGFSWTGIASNDHPTLAQQLISDVLLWNEPPSIQRAIRERILAWQATSRFGREKIIEWYLNSGDYGNLAIGADAAARVYFGKSATDLTLAESAMVAAISVSPVLNPIDAPRAAQENKTTILDKLLAQGEITQGQYTQARDEKLTLGAASASEEVISSAFTDFVINQLESLLQSDRFLLGGFKITSTMDYDLQAQASCAASFQLSRITNTDTGFDSDQIVGGCEASRLLPTFPSSSYQDQSEFGVNIIALRPETGELLAMMVQGQPEISPANPPGRPPGSLLTPFIYLSAFTRGFGPATMLWDVPASLIEGATEIKNPDGKFHGPIRLRTALANDYLVPAMQLLDQIGAVQVWRTAQQLGLRTLEIPSGEQALRLLLEDGNVPLLEISQAYGVLADQGILSGVVYGPESESSTSSPIHPLSVLEVSDNSGKIWLECSNQLGGCQLIRRPVITPQLAYLITNILSDEASRWPSLGHPNSLEIGRPAGAKIGLTGTGQDAWTVGFTSDLVLGVWIGSNTADAKIADEWVSGLWHAVIQYAARGDPATGWDLPSGLSQIDVCNPSGLLPTAICPEIVREIFLDGTEPTHTDSLFRAFQVNRESGRLATIFTPPEFVENRIFMVMPAEAMSWALEAGISLPPDSYDVIDAPPDQNTDVQITSPSLFEQVGGEVPIIGRAGGPGFDFFRLQVGQGLNPTIWSLIIEDQTRPVNGGQLALWDTTGLEGLYVLQLVVAREGDQVESTAIQVSIDNQPPQIAIRFPSDGALLSSVENQTITLAVEASDALGPVVVDYFLDGDLIASLGSPPFTYPWELSSGEHIFIARATDLAGNTEELTVNFSVKP